MTGDLTTRQYLELQDDEMDVWLELSPQGNQTMYWMILIQNFKWIFSIYSIHWMVNAVEFQLDFLSIILFSTCCYWFK